MISCTELTMIFTLELASANPLACALTLYGPGSKSSIRNSPREALSRLESMVTMGGFALPPRTLREMIVTSTDVIVQAARLRDGSRRITHITEVLGFEGDVVTTQDLMVYEVTGEDSSGRLKGRHRSTGIGRPRFWERARYYGEEERLARAIDASELNDTVR